jgi:hypothetical protein
MTVLKAFRTVELWGLLVAVFLAHPRPTYALVNYYNDPHLGKAMEFDSEKNGGDKKKADRSQAEFYYLRYLKDANEPFQRARVYCQLGSMYATSFNKEKGEKKDREKARGYYRKALEIEPQRIDACMIEVRCMLATLEHKPGFDTLKARVGVYEWLAGFNEQTLKQKWLPLQPALPPEVTTVTDANGEVLWRRTKRPPADPNVPSPSDVLGLMRLIAAVKQMTIANAAKYDTKWMPVPEEGWAYILEHLPPEAPERKIVERARQKWREQRSLSH